MIFDSDVLIWAIRGNEKAARAITSANDRALSVVSLMELLQGARSKLEVRQIHRSLNSLHFRVLPLSETIGDTAVELIGQYALSHGLELGDALIAATAIEAGVPLYTANVKHFRQIRTLAHIAFRP